MKFGPASPGNRRCESVGMAPTHGVYAVRHALFSLLVCQAYSHTGAVCAGSGRCFHHRVPWARTTLHPAAWTVEKPTQPSDQSGCARGVTLESIVRTATGYLTVTSPPSEAESLQ